MPNRNYEKGRRKEQRIVRDARDRGLIAFRSAGSHSPIDVCIISGALKKIRFIQCKPDNFSQSEKKRLEDDLSFLNDTFEVSFEVL